MQKMRMLKASELRTGELNCNCFYDISECQPYWFSSLSFSVFLQVAFYLFIFLVQARACAAPYTHVRKPLIYRRRYSGELSQGYSNHAAGSNVASSTPQRALQQPQTLPGKCTTRTPRRIARLH